MTKRPTSTSPFGVSKRESHDASAFYGRFVAPEISPDSSVFPDKDLDKLIVGDARSMPEVADGSVALVVTSPPYFAGKEYEAALGVGGVPGTYLEYLALLRDVFAECVRTLEPGGRIAVNVANLGRRPYRSLSADVTRILQDDLRLLLRGEIVWLKQRGSSGSCAWGSFGQPANPVLRDLTERVIIASKGRFDRAGRASDRAARGLPSQASMSREDFMENTLDVWEIPPESAKRVGHPAPFPLELPSRLIHLYTYRGDLVLDPFAGAGTTAVASVQAGRHYIGYDLDESYIRLAESRVCAERERTAASRGDGSAVFGGTEDSGGDTPHIRLLAEGRSSKEVARVLIEGAGFTVTGTDVRQVGALQVTFAALDPTGREWLFEVAGGLTRHREGLKRQEVMWKAIAKASVLHHGQCSPFVLLAAGTPQASKRSPDPLGLVSGPGKPIRAVVDLADFEGSAKLAALYGESNGLV